MEEKDTLHAGVSIPAVRAEASLRREDAIPRGQLGVRDAVKYPSARCHIYAAGVETEQRGGDKLIDGVGAEEFDDIGMKEATGGLEGGASCGEGLEEGEGVVVGLGDRGRRRKRLE